MLGRLPEADPGGQRSVKAKASDGEQDTKTKPCTHVEVAQKRKKAVTEYISPRLVFLLEREKNEEVIHLNLSKEIRWVGRERACMRPKINRFIHTLYRVEPHPPRSKLYGSHQYPRTPSRPRAHIPAIDDCIFRVESR